MEGVWSEAGVRRLLWAINHPPVYTTGVSEAAVSRLTGFVETLEDIDPEALRPAMAGGDPDARRHVRYLAALVPDDIPDDHLPDAVWWLIQNQRLSVPMLREVLSDANREESGARLRQAARRLRDGQTQTRVARELHMDARTVRALSAFLGVVEARVEAQAEAEAELVNA